MVASNTVTKMSQTKKWPRDQAIDLPNYVVHVYQSIYEKNWRSRYFSVYKGNYHGNRAKKTKHLKKSFSDGFFANLRPLYDSNVTRVSIVKLSQNWIFWLEV